MAATHWLPETVIPLCGHLHFSATDSLRRRGLATYLLYDKPRRPRISPSVIAWALHHPCEDPCRRVSLPIAPPSWWLTAEIIGSTEKRVRFHNDM
ncbi:hypothetical protein NDU88_007909, partial [Pleurodeles waltl]